jgi:hypothetical protein
MTDKVNWVELTPRVWAGYVNHGDGPQQAYKAIDLEAVAWVARSGARDGFRMTHIGWAKEIAEMQEEMDASLLDKYGLLLPAA